MLTYNRATSITKTNKTNNRINKTRQYNSLSVIVLKRFKGAIWQDKITAVVFYIYN